MELDTFRAALPRYPNRTGCDLPETVYETASFHDGLLRHLDQNWILRKCRSRQQ